MNVIIFFGKPGSGKDTQAKLLASDYKIPTINFGEYLRNHTELLSDEEKELIKQGHLLSNDKIESIFKNALKSVRSNTIIINGFPRTIHQAQALLKENLNIYLFNLRIADIEAKKRLEKRQNSENRVDDNQISIIKRLKIFTTETKPIIQILKTDNQLFDIDGERNIEDIYNEVKSICDNKIRL